MNCAAVVSACDECFCLPADAVVLCDLLRQVKKLLVINGGAVHIGYHGAFSQQAAALVALGKGNIRRCGSFEHYGKIGSGIKCCRPCASETYLFLGHKGKCAVVLGNILQYHCNHYRTACTVVYCLGAHIAVLRKGISAGVISIIAGADKFFGFRLVLCADVDVKPVEFRGSFPLVLGHVVNSLGAHRAVNAVFGHYLPADNSVRLNAAHTVESQRSVGVYPCDDKPHLVHVGGYHKLLFGRFSALVFCHYAARGEYGAAALVSYFIEDIFTYILFSSRSAVYLAQLF